MLRVPTWLHWALPVAGGVTVRPPSPPPVYDKGGNRLNTRDVRIRRGHSGYRMIQDDSGCRAHGFRTWNILDYLGTMALGSFQSSTEFHRVAAFQEGHDSRVQQTDQAGLWDDVLQMVCLCLLCLFVVALRYMIKHVDGYLPPVDWKPSKLMKKIIIPIDPRAQIICKLQV